MSEIKQNNIDLNETQNPNLFRSGAVTTESGIASEVGMRILQRGGNAVDAAIVTGICVGIVNSFSSGIGGGGIMLIRKPGEDEIADMFDFRETAPRKLTSGILKENPGSTRRTGLSVAVPGEIRGLYDAHCEYGKLPWKELFEEPIKLARGFPATKLLVKRLNLFKEDIFRDAGLSEIYTRNNEIIKEGEIVVRENYAKTLEQIAVDPESFYKGEIAKSIVRAIKASNGVMDMKDMKNYRAIKRKVQTGSYKDYTVYAPDLPTSGISIIQALNILENFDLEDILSKDKRNNTFFFYHLMVEVSKFIYARRGEFADPSFVAGLDELRKEITSKECAHEIASKITMSGVLPVDMYGMKRPGNPTHGTTHVNVLDSEEMTVLLTTSVNLEFGAKYMDKETGIVLNNHIDDFYVEGVRNFYGLESVGVNTLEPLKRPFSSMAPVILSRDNETIAIGGVGGIKITSSVLFTLFGILSGKPLRECVSEPRLHHQFKPMTVFVESDFPDTIIQYLQDVGHRVEKAPSDRPDSAVFVIVLKKDMNGNKAIEAVSDPRKGGDEGSFGW